MGWRYCEQCAKDDSDDPIWWLCEGAIHPDDMLLSKGDEDALPRAPCPTHALVSRAPLAPLVLQGEVSQNDGEKYVALYVVHGELLVGSSLYDNVEQVRIALSAFKPERVYAIKFKLPREESK